MPLRIRDVKISICYNPPLKVTVKLEPYTEYHRLRPTQEQLGSCPDIFRCYVCQGKREKKHFGGELAGERVCRYCGKYVDSWDVGCMIRFDNRFKPRYSKEAKEKPPQPEQTLTPELLSIWWDKWQKGEAIPPDKIDKIKEIATRIKWLVEEGWKEKKDEPANSEDSEEQAREG